MKSHDNIINTSFFLLRYFFLLFIAIIITNILSKSFAPFLNYTSITITAIFYTELLLFNLKYVVSSKVGVWKVVLMAIVDISLFLRVAVLYKQDKRGPDKRRTFENMEYSFYRIFVSGFLLPIGMYLVYAFQAILLYYWIGGVSNVPTKLLPSKTLTHAILSYLSSYILLHNLIVMFEILFGSILFFTVSFGLLYYSGGVSIGIMVVSIINGTADLIFPNGILELLALALASGVGISIFSLVYQYFAGTFRSENEFRKYFSVNIPKVIVGIGIIIVLVLFAWDMEYSILLKTSAGVTYPHNWFYILYVLDFSLAVVSVTILLRIYKFGIIAPLEFIFYFFPPFLLLFSITAGHSFYWSDATEIFTTLTLLIISLAMVIFTALGLPETLTSSAAILENDEFSILKAAGRSMNPIISEGELVVVFKTADKALLKTGEVMLLRIPMKYSPPARSGRYVAHRLLDIVGRNLITKGDNQPKPDSKVPIWYWEGVAVAKLLMGSNESVMLEQITSDDALFAGAESKKDELVSIVRNADKKAGRHGFLHSRINKGFVTAIASIALTLVAFVA